MENEERVPEAIRGEYVAWLKELTEEGTERKVHRTLVESDVWRSKYVAMEGDRESSYPQAEKVGLEGNHDEPALRRIYPHFVRSREKTKRVSVGGIGDVHLATRRVTWIESQEKVKQGGTRNWWERQVHIRRGPRECWGLSPEV